MWMLKKESDETTYYACSSKDIHTVGRANTDLVLTEDKSISRTHANIQIKNGEIFIIDIGSTYGTYKNEGIEKVEKLIARTPIKFEEGDRVQFGRLNNAWIVTRINIQILTSRLTDVQNKELAKIIQKLDGNIVESWSNKCTHLTMRSIIITHKLIISLLAGIPIVTPQYWKACIKSVSKNEPLIDYKQYIPPSGDSFLQMDNIDLTIRKDRNLLFLHKLFVFFLSTHMNRFEEIIKLAGGSCVSLDQTKMNKKKFFEENVIVVINDEAKKSNKFFEIENYLKEKDEHTISDTEIFQAIIYITTKNFCNPKSNKKYCWPINKNNKVSQLIAPDLENIKIFNIHKSSVPLQSITIPETLQETYSEDSIIIVDPKIKHNHKKNNDTKTLKPLLDEEFLLDKSSCISQKYNDEIDNSIKTNEQLEHSLNIEESNKNKILKRKGETIDHSLPKQQYLESHLAENLNDDLFQTQKNNHTRHIQEIDETSTLQNSNILDSPLNINSNSEKQIEFNYALPKHRKSHSKAQKDVENNLSKSEENINKTLGLRSKRNHSLIDSNDLFDFDDNIIQPKKPKIQKKSEVTIVTMPQITTLPVADTYKHLRQPKIDLDFTVGWLSKLNISLTEHQSQINGKSDETKPLVLDKVFNVRKVSSTVIKLENEFTCSSVSKSDRNFKKFVKKTNMTKKVIL